MAYNNKVTTHIFSNRNELHAMIPHLSSVVCHRTRYSFIVLFEEHYSLAKCDSLRAMCVRHPVINPYRILYTYIFSGRLDLDKCQSVLSQIAILTHLHRKHSHSTGY